MVALQERNQGDSTDHRERKDRAPLSRDKILAAGIAVVEKQGFEGLTIRNVAKELGFAPMALYTHIKNKEELVDGVLDALLSRVQLKPATGADWQADLRGFVQSYRALLIRYPDSVPYLIAGAGHETSGSRRIMEGLLRIFRGAGYEDRAAVTGAFTVLQFVYGSAYLAAPPINEDPSKVRAALQGLPASQFTTTVRTAGELTRVPAGQRFDQTLDVVIEGLEAGLERQGGIGRFFGFGRK